MKKSILILSVLVGMCIGTKAQTIYQLRVDGNMFIISDTTANPDVIRNTFPVEHVQYTPNFTNESVQFYSMKGQFMMVGNSAYSLTRLVDENKDVFPSFASLIFWLNNNLSGDILTSNKSYNFTVDENKTGEYFRGNYTVQSMGTYGGGSLFVEYSANNTDWTAISTFTTDTVRNIEVAGYVRTSLSGSTTPDLDVFIQKIR